MIGAVTMAVLTAAAVALVYATGGGLLALCPALPGVTAVAACLLLHRAARR